MKKRIADLGAAMKAVKHAVDIVDIVREDLGPQQRESGQNTWWWCPFHNEKDKPSFAVHSSYQIYKCFGCQESGDVFKWLQSHRGMSYGEAVRFIAANSGTSIDQFLRDPTPEELERDRLTSVCNAVASYCNTMFLHNEQMLSWYLSDTGFEQWQVEEYQVGYSPSVQSIMEFVHSKHGLRGNEIERLEFHRQNLWDHALVYPVHDAGGNVCRFYTKPLGGGDGKYMSTSHQHPLFSHGLVYGLHIARRHLRQRRNARLVVVEGQKACIAAGGATVAAMGVNFRKEQADTLRDLGLSKITVCFDSDVAGYQAALNVLDKAENYVGMDVRVAKLPLEFPQVDQLIKAEGRAAYDAAIESAVSPIEFWVSSQYDIKQLGLNERLDMVRRLKNYFNTIPRIEGDVLAEYLSQVLNIPKESITQHIDETRAAKYSLANAEAEASLLHYLIASPANIAAAKKQAVTSDHFTIGKHGQIFKGISGAHVKHGSKYTLQSILEELDILYPTGTDAREAAVSMVAMTAKHQFEPALSVVVDLWRRRQTASRATALISAVRDLSTPTLGAVQEFRRTMVNMVDQRENQPTTPQEISEAGFRVFQQRMDRGGGIIGHDFSSLLDIDGARVGGLPILNTVASGLQETHLTVVAGQQGTGKSLLALNIAACIAVNQRVPTLWIAQEMQAEEQSFRLVSLLSGVDNNRVQRAAMETKDEYLRVEKAFGMIHSSQLYIVTPRVGSVDEIYAIIDDYRFRYGIKVVVWDYIQLVQSGPEDRGRAHHEIIGRASNMFKHQVAVDMKIAAVAVAQINRKAASGTAHTGEDMGGAYKVSQDADNIYIISEKTMEQIAEQGSGRGNRIINIDKRRGGPSDIILDSNLDSEHATLRFAEAVAPQDAAAILTGII